MNTDTVRPAVTELRLSAFKTHRGVTLPLTRLTLLSGESGSGKSSALQAYEILARLGSGESLARAVGEVAGSPAACVPAGARPDEQGRRGFRIGCTVDGPAGPVSLDLAVQAEPELRIVGERLTGGGETLLTTALTDPNRPSVQAAWHTAGATPVTRAPLPDDRLGTSLLPLRVAGKTEGQRLVLAAAEQVVVALRSAFVCDPRPEVMRGVGTGGTGGTGQDGGCGADGAGGAGRGVGVRRSGLGAGSGGGPGKPGGAGGTAGAVGAWGTRKRKGSGGGEAGSWGRDTEGARGEGRLRSSCDNLPAVLERTSQECARRHAVLVAAVREACAGPVEGLRAVPRQAGGTGHGAADAAGVAGPGGSSGPQAGAVGVRAVLDRGALGELPVEQLGDGELRFLALALVLLTGPEVLAMDPVGEVPSAHQQMTVMADGMDRCMDPRQARELVSLALRMTDRGHVRLLGTVRDPSVAEGLPGVQVLHLGV
ncbi:biotin transporter BioY [Streptomyces sp. Je 1-4]|uniref:biotin transporter BioY n=1 Tax=Streptomyces TaxID=1883 RepID=UPI0021DB369E|nr:MULTISPECIES: biotin transporter BioY [unclassified Streptomyces]UYB39449.1 biotin transporter BioY [Streptomyces sp. Je 1-4]UZQ35480.1 biotin transporter BioY [Streptomyces sp. Je 1-4] [Streptomyces sp. Je 1-4 4N24]UZQ42898.1 biotin transporter BioY [Streptomyces sp. Je 1-4] [Streptomyces sp. Je 1-4 4N24_ara]